MDELLETFVSGKLSKEGQQELFSTTKYQRQEVLDKFFDIVVKKGGDISYDAAKVFIAVYHEFGNDKTSGLEQSTISNILSAKPIMRNIFGSLDRSVYEFCLGPQNENLSLKKLDNDLFDKIRHERDTNMAINIHYSSDFAEKRKAALDGLIDYIKDFPSEILKQIAPEIEVKSTKLTDYMQENWDRLSDDQLLKIAEVTSEKFLALMGNDKDLKIRPFTKAMLKDPEYENLAGNVEAGETKTIDENILKIRSEVTPPASVSNNFKADYIKYHISELLSVAVHEADHLIQRDIKSYTANPQDLKTSLFNVPQYYYDTQERDAFLIKNYFSQKLKELMHPTDDYINTKWEARNNQAVFLYQNKDGKMEKLVLDKDFFKIATDIFGFAPPDDDKINNMNKFSAPSTSNKASKAMQLK